MILSVSRRTDISAFYFDWFLNRLEEGYLCVKNPLNARQVGRVALNEKSIDCIVFWTKNPENALPKLDRLGGYMYYFQYTLNPYGSHIEKNVPPLEQRIETFKKLSEKIGKERVIWRYDPIFMTEELDAAYHLEKFKQLSEALGSHTGTVVIGVLTYYRKIKKNMEALSCREITEKELALLIPRLKEIAGRHGLGIYCCADELNLGRFGIEPGRCIDHRLIARLLGEEVELKKDKNQRAACRCVESIDVGAYNTCRHGCRYCYANQSEAFAAENYKMHDPGAPLLAGELRENDIVMERKVIKYAGTGCGLQPANH